jgi:hypothetical protein
MPHYTETLLAGPVPFNADVKAFVGFGLPIPEFFVTLSGQCELGITICGLGLSILRCDDRRGISSMAPFRSIRAAAGNPRF